MGIENLFWWGVIAAGYLVVGIVVVIYADGRLDAGISRWSAGSEVLALLLVIGWPMTVPAAWLRRVSPSCREL